MMKWILSVILQLYCLWGTIYRFFSVKPVPQITSYQKFGSFVSYFHYVLTNHLREYQKDKVYQLGDVIMHPWEAIHKGYGDCDEHASLMGYLLPPVFTFNFVAYTCIGLFALVYSKAPHHMICVWKCKSGYVVVSDRKLITFPTWERMITSFKKNNKELQYLGMFKVTHFPDTFDVQFKTLARVNI